MSLLIILMNVFFSNTLFKENMMDDQIKKYIEDVRPSLQADGGDVEFVRYDEETKIAYVRLKGSCHGCPMSQITLKQGIEKYLKDNIAELHSVESV